MTGNFTSIARPYALAAFEYALAKNALPAWEELLQSAATVVEDPLIITFMASPEVSAQQLVELFCEVLASQLNEEQKNFIRLLAEHRRFSVLPDIVAQFKQYREAHEKTVTVDVASAIELDEKQKISLSQALEKRLQLKVTLVCTVDPDLLGGAIIRAGDKVIDGSVRGKLNRMIEFI
jgi:F-type H+-transporting ATPase subunit delta